MKNKPTFLLLDGNALLHRAWHAIPPLTTQKGLVVNAAYGFAMVVEKMLETYKPEYMAVAWDVPGGTFRDGLYEEYKATREKKEQELYDQIPMIQEILEAFGIPSIEVPGYEADDIIGTLSKKAEKKGIHTYIVTGDLDSLQLVSEDSEVLFFQKGISQTKLYDIDAVKERYGLTPREFIDYKALRGDPSDNIPGVAGVGEKTATMLLQRYGSIEEMFNQLDSLEEKYAKKLRGQEDVVELSKQLVTIVRDVKCGFRFTSAKVGSPDIQKLIQLYRELEFKTLLRKYGEQPLPSTKQKKSSRSVQITIVKNVDELSTGFASAASIGVLMATQSEDLFGSTLAAIGLTDGKSTTILKNPSQTMLHQLIEILVAAETVYGHNVKQLMHQLNVPLTNIGFDTMIASYVLQSGSRAHTLEEVLQRFFPKEQILSIPEQFSKEKDYERFGSLLAMMPMLVEEMNKELEKTETLTVLKDIELPLISLLYRMEAEGIELDTKSLGAFSSLLTKKVTALTKKIIKLAGVEFNLNSPSQLATVLFEQMELPTKGIKKTKTGYSTAASELEKLWETHEIIPLISEYRELTKLQSTYVDTLPKLVAKDGRIHTSFNQTVAATGRLSSSDPNLQNIPIKTELGREIRKAFVAPKGSVLLAADYSQIELRLAAVIAKDIPFITAFNEGADIHTRTAAEVWGVSEKDVTSEQRRAAKAINFGILYGMGPRSLSRSTGLSMKEAKEFIEKYFDIHHAIKKYLDETKIKAHEDGFVETLFGRRRYFPEIQSGVPMLVSMAERMAINMPIQGTQADIIKKAMLRVDQWLQKSAWPAKMLLQVHDELVLEVKEEAVDAVKKGVRDMMESVAEFEVPLVVSINVGKNWGDLK